MDTRQLNLWASAASDDLIATLLASEHQYFHGRPDSSFDVDAAANSKEDIKAELESVTGRKKFLWWRLTKTQFIPAIVSSALLFLAILVVILWLTAFKTIFQNNLDKVMVSINFLDIKSIPSDTVLVANMSLRLKHNLPFNAHTDEATTSLRYGGQEFATFTFPALEADKGEQEYDPIISDNITITNAAVFEAMPASVVDLPNVTMSASAKVKAHALGFSYGGLDFERELEVDGVNNFRDPLTVIDHVDFFGCDDRFAMDIRANVTNVAQMGLDGLGFLNLTLYFAQLYLGYLESMTPEIGMPRELSAPIFRLYIESDSDAMPVLVRDLLAGHLQYYITGEMPNSSEHEPFQAALVVMNISISLKDGMERTELNTSCMSAVLSLAG